jgi:hypothetical protein
MAVVLAWPLTLRAEPAFDDSYETLVRLAIQAQAAGDFETSYALFARAHAQNPNARTLRALGVAAFQRGHEVQAIGHLEAALVHSEKPLDQELRVAVEELLRRARAKVGVFRVEVEPAQAELRVDDEPLVRELSRPIYLEPGEHTLFISAAGYQARELGLRVHAGQNEGLRVALAAEPVTEPAQPIAAAAPPSARAAPLTVPLLGRAPARVPTLPKRRRARWALVGVAAASGAAGLGLWFAANGRVDTIADACAEAGGCTRAQLAAELERANLRAFEIGCDAAIAVTGTALVGATALWLSDGRPWPSLKLSHRALGLRWSGRF